MTEEEKKKKKSSALDALKLLGSGLAKSAGVTLAGRKKQLDEQIKQAGG